MNIMLRMPQNKFVKKVKKKVPWIEHLIENDVDAFEFYMGKERKRGYNELCIICRGTKKLCGKEKCPVVIKFYSYIKRKRIIEKTEFHGITPPEVFIGRFNYPNVRVGPLTSPLFIKYLPMEYWIEKYEDIEEFIDERLNYIRSFSECNINVNKNRGKIIEQIQEIVLSSKSAYADVELLKKPKLTSYMLDLNTQPFGPCAPIKRINVYGTRSDKFLEKVSYDSDLKAKEAIIELYKNKVLVSKIQQLLSAGLLGLRHQRRLVPTRWSITAVDSIISAYLRDNYIKNFPLINEFRIFEYSVLDNKFVVIMIPDAWSYEFIEAWFPGTPWNISKTEIAICGDYETFRGRWNYAVIGGCYYACRLAVTEYLFKERRQARVIVLRESYPGYILPIGVWLVREAVRRALRRSFIKFDNMKEVLEHLRSTLKISLETWIQVSELIKDYLSQTKLYNFF